MPVARRIPPTGTFSRDGSVPPAARRPLPPPAAQRPARRVPGLSRYYPVVRTRRGFLRLDRNHCGHLPPQTGRV